MPAYSCLMLSRRSPTLWHLAVPIHAKICFHRPRSLAAAAPVRFICDPPGIFSSLLDPRPGTTARTAPILGILEVVGRYQYRYNFRPRVVIPLQGSRHRHASSLSVYVYYNFSTFLSPPTSF
jgi:hypothetical protein